MQSPSARKSASSAATVTHPSLPQWEGGDEITEAQLPQSIQDVAIHKPALWRKRGSGSWARQRDQRTGMAAAIPRLTFPGEPPIPEVQNLDGAMGWCTQALHRIVNTGLMHGRTAVQLVANRRITTSTCFSGMGTSEVADALISNSVQDTLTIHKPIALADSLITFPCEAASFTHALLMPGVHPSALGRVVGRQSERLGHVIRLRRRL